MTYATGLRHDLSYVPEENFGVTPEEPEMIRLRHTACNVGLSRTMLASEEISETRQLSHLLPGQETVSGDIDMELSYGACDDWLAAALQSDWRENVLLIGADQTSFTLQRGFDDIGQYQQLTGCIIDQFSLSLRPDRLAGGKFSVIGTASQFAGTSLDATPTAAPAHDPMDGYAGTIEEGGSRLAQVAAADLLIDNNHDQAFTLGSRESRAILSGSARVSGELVCYFEDARLLDKFITGTSSSLTVTLQGSGGGYAFHLPKILYTGAENAVAGAGPITLSLPFTGLFDNAVGSSLSVTRTAP